MATTVRTVALCSATGKLGPYLLSALQKEGFAVTIISRASSKGVFPASQKVTTVSDEYTEEELTAAFRGHDAVVLCLSFEQLGQTGKFARASIAAGVRWLVASTYAANLEDPRAAEFPASIPHRQAVDELKELQKKADDWAWTAISCGPWPELSVAAGAWKIDAEKKTAELVDGGNNVFTSSTREQISLAVARILSRQPDTARNKIAYVSSFEVTMLNWLGAYKKVVGEEGWTITETDGQVLLKKSQEQLAAGDFTSGYVGTALVVCTGKGYQNQYSSFTTLINKELDLPEEDIVEVVRHGLSLPNPFA